MTRIKLKAEETNTVYRTILRFFTEADVFNRGRDRDSAVQELTQKIVEDLETGPKIVKKYIVERQDVTIHINATSFSDAARIYNEMFPMSSTAGASIYLMSEDRCASILLGDMEYLATIINWETIPDIVSATGHTREVLANNYAKWAVFDGAGSTEFIDNAVFHDQFLITTWRSHDTFAEVQRRAVSETTKKNWEEYDRALNDFKLKVNLRQVEYEEAVFISEETWYLIVRLFKGSPPPKDNFFGFWAVKNSDDTLWLIPKKEFRKQYRFVGELGRNWATRWIRVEKK